jgi:hypothetical protein
MLSTTLLTFVLAFEEKFFNIYMVKDFLTGGLQFSNSKATKYCMIFYSLSGSHTKSEWIADK